MIYYMELEPVIIFEPEPHGRRRDMQLHIVGVRHYITDDAERQKFIDNAPNLSLIMACEPTNPVDPRAIAVYETSSVIPRRVAYISTENLLKAHGVLDAYNVTSMPIRALGLQPGRHTTLVAYPIDPDGELIKDIEEIETPDNPQPQFNIGSIGSIGQFNAGNSVYNAAPAKNEENEKTHEADSSSTDGKDNMRKAIVRIAKFISTHKDEVWWSDVYYCMKRRGDIGAELSPNAFGDLVERLGGPKAQTVRKSGDYQLSTAQLQKRDLIITLLTYFFSDI